MLPAESCFEVVASAAAVPAPATGARAARSGSTLLPIATLVLWGGCLIVGSLGFALPYARPVSPKPVVETQAELLNVELTNEPLSPLDPEPAPANLPPPLEPLLAPAAVPPMLAVAPMDQVAFALPVEGPARMVNPDQAAYTHPTEKPAAAPAPVQTLTYGVGEGRQPAPHYPRAAVRAGQEGKVSVRFCVGENGRVLDAETAKPSPWPLLNDEAVRTVRQRWRFGRGPVRVYEVTIRFELQGTRADS